MAPLAITALEDALATVYWYKDDLRRFLTVALTKADLLTPLDWSDSKRNVVRALVGRLSAHQDLYLDDLLILMSEISQMEDFSHLQRLDDGEVKVRHARAAVAALRKHIEPHREVLSEQRAAEEHRRIAGEAAQKKRAEADGLAALFLTFNQLLGSGDASRRGYLLEKLLKDLFDLFDLDPKASFKTFGEQIDGAFNFEGTDYILEARWQVKPADTGDLEVFNGKIGRKLDNTLGLFLSINGFAPNAVTIHSGARPKMVLMEGRDLVAVLEGRIRLPDLLRRKRQHASHTGEILLPIGDILG